MTSMLINQNGHVKQRFFYEGMCRKVSLRFNQLAKRNNHFKIRLEKV